MEKNTPVSTHEFQTCAQVLIKTVVENIENMGTCIKTRHTRRRVILEFVLASAETRGVSSHLENPRHVLANSLKNGRAASQHDIGVRILAVVYVSLLQDFLRRDPNAVVVNLAGTTLARNESVWLKQFFRLLSLCDATSLKLIVDGAESTVMCSPIL